MKNQIRILSFILSMILLLSSLNACDTPYTATEWNPLTSYVRWLEVFGF